MANAIIMPKAGMSMETGIVLTWFKAEGDHVEKGEPLLEIETDKVSMEVEAEFTGTLLKIVASEGQEVPVTQTIGFIGAPDEQILVGSEELPVKQSLYSPGISTDHTTASLHPNLNETKLPGHKYAVDRRVPATPKARRIAKERSIDLWTVTGSGAYGAIMEKDLKNILSSSLTVDASPLAIRLARAEAIDLMGLSGTGPRGRIMKRDVLTAGIQKTQSSRSATVITDSDGGIVRKKPSRMRMIVAERMTLSASTIPAVTLNIDVDITALVSLRTEENEKSSVRLSYNDFVIAAAARVVREMTEFRSFWDNGELIERQAVHIGMAVALEDGLVVPVVRHADTLTVYETARITADLAGRAKNLKLSPDEIKGAGFTVSNLGMFGISAFTPIIDPGQSAILGVCSIQQVGERKTMGFSLTIDHRIIDGAKAAIFLKCLGEVLAKPVELL